MKLKFILLCLFFHCILFNAQSAYTDIRKKYENFEENNEKAFLYINQYISKAKKEKHYDKLVQGYKDGVVYSPDQKIKYADSTIYAAHLSKDNDLIGNAYVGKGIIYYFNYRKFKPALDEYLQAYNYLQHAKDPFLKYQNLYHIGVVKSYLGYHQEALQIFKECIAYFEPNTKSNIHPNLIFNNQKGYLNSVHQAIICNQALGNFTEAQKLIDSGLHNTPSDKDFYLERSYFTKTQGINNFRVGNYRNAVSLFNQALPGLRKKDDFTWVSIVYFYRGKSFAALGNREHAVQDFQKVDSIFNKYSFILPEVRQNYEQLIKYYKENNNPEKELYYTKRLLRADSIISNDFKYLSTRIHKDYDTRTLLLAKKNLENTNSLVKYLIFLCVAIIVILGAVIVFRLRKQKEVQAKYDELMVKINISDNIEENNEPLEFELNKTSRLDQEIVEKLLSRISAFENQNSFLEQGLTLNKMAGQLETNTSYLSQVINEYKGSNFNTYINTLRINYATRKIYDDKHWRKYSVEVIAKECGFSNRQSFSNIFYEQNGIRPADFIKKRKRELEDQQSFSVANPLT